MSDPYAPMPATIEDEGRPASKPEPVRFAPDHGVTFTGLLATTFALTKKHFLWCFATLLIPEVIDLAISESAGLAIVEHMNTAEQAIVIFGLYLPLSVAASAAVTWRMVGSARLGPLATRAPKSTFCGFALAGRLLLYWLLTTAVYLLCAVPLIALWHIATDFTDVPIAAAMEDGTFLAAFVVASIGCLAALAMILSRWFIAFEISVAEDVPLGVGLKRSALFVRHTQRSSLPFFIAIYLFLSWFFLFLEVADIEILDLLLRRESSHPFISQTTDNFFSIVRDIVLSAAGAALFLAYKKAKIVAARIHQ